jgi:hypothetical protein
MNDPMHSPCAAKVLYQSRRTGTHRQYVLPDARPDEEAVQPTVRDDEGRHGALGM